jgi:hypothetical protein
VVMPHEPADCWCAGARLPGHRHPGRGQLPGADFLAHSRVGRVVAIEGSRFTVAYQAPAGTTRRARFDLANPHDVLAVEAAR